jgi:hypothetical protein
MTHILLTGAGFSHNWGGMLAEGVFSYLLGCDELDDETRGLLWRARSNRGGFEDVLAALQLATDVASKKRHHNLTSALVGMFNGMGLAFMQREFEFKSPPDTRYSLTSFLQRFDAIFTLNQDTLLEQKYLPSVGPPKWGRGHQPGLKYPAGWCPTGTAHDRVAVMEPNPSDFTLAPGTQPYIKLHGSCNWNESPSGGRILIMGGQKALSINQFPLLTWYHDEFKRYLMRPEARLMIIGYSFSDAHINQAILDAVTGSQLKLFLVEPAGEKVLDKRDPRAQIPDHPGELMLQIPRRLIGMSQVPLSSTFNGNLVEHANLSRFFRGAA